MQSGLASREVVVRSPSYTLNVFSLMAFAALVLFGTLQILTEHDAMLGLTEIIGGGIIALNVFILRMSHNVDLARDLLLFIILAFLIVMLITGGTEGTGILWFFTFPVATYFLAGKRRGTYWMLTLLLAVIAILVLVNAEIMTIAYSFVTVRQLLITLAVVGGGMYAYQQAREGVEWQLRREQEAVDTAKNEFLALASHQLRTPVSAIKWFSEMLLHGDAGKLSKDQREYVLQVYTSNQRSAAIIDAIITISDLHTGTISTRFEIVDIAHLCHRMLKAQTTDSLLAGKLHIEEQYDESLPKLQCDVGLMQTIMQNLFSNAIKYTPAGGHIIVATERSEHKCNPKSQGSVAISVSDTGYGIPKNEQDKIFTQLFRATNIKAKDTDGTGLGLYIVKAILGRVGGDVLFESEEKKGSIFTIMLPLEGMFNQEQLMSEGIPV